MSLRLAFCVYRLKTLINRFEVFVSVVSCINSLAKFPVARYSCLCIPFVAFTFTLSKIKLHIQIKQQQLKQLRQGKSA